MFVSEIIIALTAGVLRDDQHDLNNEYSLTDSMLYTHFSLLVIMNIGVTYRAEVY